MSKETTNPIDPITGRKIKEISEEIDIENSNELEIYKGFHPILYRSNNLENTKTYPQDILLNKENKIIVISG